MPIRYGRMSESPFGFYRGAAAVMAADLAGTATTTIPVQLCGDAHLVNFGGFATPERRLIFDVNDFDETLPGPWEWDLERLGASFAVAARAKSLDDKDGQNAVERVVLTYADILSHVASVPTLDAWYWSIDADVVGSLMKTSGAKSKRLADKAVERAHAHDRLQAVSKLTEVVDGHRRIIDQLPLVGHVPGDDELGRITARSPTTGPACSTTASTSSTVTTSSTPPGKWSASAASAPGAGSPSSRAATTTTH